jgi:hypothetical protein
MCDPADFLLAHFLIRINRAGGGVDEFSRRRRSRQVSAPQGELLVIPGWYPHRRPASLLENAQHFAGLAANVDLQGWSWRRTAVVATDASWAEGALAVAGAAESEVLALAAVAGQDLIFRVAPGAVEVRGPSGELRRTLAVGFRDLGAVPCPMQPGVLEPCRNPGGPWGGRSRAVAGQYIRDQERLFAAMGCSICGGNFRPTPPLNPIGNEDRVAGNDHL